MIIDQYYVFYGDEIAGEIFVDFVIIVGWYRFGGECDLWRVVKWGNVLVVYMW
jgi:hypothetical protein